MIDSGRAVFLSYASQDSEATLQLCNALRQAGIEVWFDQSELRGGDAWDASIRRQIKTCALFIPIISRNTHARDEGYFRLEWKLAVDRSYLMTANRPFLVPVVIDDTSDQDEQVPERFRDVQWTRLSGGQNAEAFVERVRRLLSPDATTPSATSVRTSALPTVSMGAASTRAMPVTSRSFVPWIVGGLLILGAGYLVAERLLASKHAAPMAEAAAPAQVEAVSDKSIAVLPFTDMSEKKDQEYFADGMAEEVLDLLAKIPHLRVIGRTSSFQFKGKSEDLRAIGHTLGADYVVEGSVRKSGDRLRITAQLIGTQDGSHLWSDAYDEASGDVLKVQGQIAAGLVRALQVSVGADDLQSSLPLKRTEAYDLYLRGRYAFDRFDRPGFEAAAGYFQQALDLDPSLARAADWLASTLENLAEWGYVQPIEGFEHARLATRHALQLNPRSALAHCQLAAISLIFDWNWAAAEREAEQARALGPRDADAISEAAQVQSALGRWDEGARLIRASMAIDPFFAGWHEMYGNILFRQGRFAEAEAELRTTLQISPTYGSGHYYLGQILMFQGKFDEALAEMRQEAPDTGRDAGLASVYYAMGRKSESSAVLARVSKERGGDVAFEIAQAHAYRGEKDQAFVWLDRAYRQKDVELYWIKGDRLLTNLEVDPRYKAFLRKMKLPE